VEHTRNSQIRALAHIVVIISLFSLLRDSVCSQIGWRILDTHTPHSLVCKHVLATEWMKKITTVKIVLGNNRVSEPNKALRLPKYKQTHKHTNPPFVFGCLVPRKVSRLCWDLSQLTTCEALFAASLNVMLPMWRMPSTHLKAQHNSMNTKAQTTYCMTRVLGRLLSTPFPHRQRCFEPHSPGTKRLEFFSLTSKRI